ncbi:hypothetical protein R0K17_11730 [Planococcus sp. SIMBA_143]
MISLWIHSSGPFLFSLRYKSENIKNFHIYVQHTQPLFVSRERCGAKLSLFAVSIKGKRMPP